jgi:tetratricopeptide (TPR) repeat protein
MEQYTRYLSYPQRNEVDNRKVRHLLDMASYEDARRLTTKILNRKTITDPQHVDMLILRGNLEIRLGRIEKGTAYFEEAVNICEEGDLKTWYNRALNARGWAYRQQGYLDEALQDYLKAYQLSVILDDQWRIALILNNIGYVKALKGNQHDAVEDCEAALKLWEEIGFGRTIGSTYSTLGEIYRRYNQLPKALAYYNKALEIFSEENDAEWMSIVYTGRATVYMLNRQLDEAEADLRWALKNGPKSYLPRMLHTSAWLQFHRGNLQGAREQLIECRKVSREVGDSSSNYKSFIDLAGLAWDFGEYYRWKKFVADHNKYYGDPQGEVKLRLYGSFLRKIGDLAICHKDYSVALEFYKRGLLLIAQYEVHELFSVSEQIHQMEKRIRKAGLIHLLGRLGSDLTDFWQSHDVLLTKSPISLVTFKGWEREADA